MAPTALQIACSDGNLEQVRDILSSSSSPSLDELDEALIDATFKGQAEAVAILLSHGARLTKIAFLGATNSRNSAVFQEFLNNGWDINSVEFGDPGLRLIVRDEACVKWFLEHGADPNVRNEKGITVLATAALHPSITILELLLSHGAEVDPEALYSAITRRGQGGVPVMRFLIDHGIDVNSPSKQWGTPLSYAVRIADREKVKLLVESGADRTVRNSIGQTLAEQAKSIGHEELCELLGD